MSLYSSLLSCVLLPFKSMHLCFWAQHQTLKHLFWSKVCTEMPCFFGFMKHDWRQSSMPHSALHLYPHTVPTLYTVSSWKLSSLEWLDGFSWMVQPLMCECDAWPVGEEEEASEEDPGHDCFGWLFTTLSLPAVQTGDLWPDWNECSLVGPGTQIDALWFTPGTKSLRHQAGSCDCPV